LRLYEAIAKLFFEILVLFHYLLLHACRTKYNNNINLHYSVNSFLFMQCSYFSFPTILLIKTNISAFMLLEILTSNGTTLYTRPLYIHKTQELHFYMIQISGTYYSILLRPRSVYVTTHSVDQCRVFTLKYMYELEEKPFTSSLNICPEACCRKG
jgi:hypothetical protein